MACRGQCRFDDSKDPLDFKISGNQLPLVQTKISRGFTITTDGYMSLCSRVYAALCIDFPTFSEIPESVFQYYATIMLWKRIVEILPSSEICKSGFFSEIAILNEGDWYVSGMMPIFLKGIGNFCDPDGCDREFLLPMIPLSETISGVRYTFGKVNAKTHVLYEAFPTPGIAALRILADMKYTRDAREENLYWDLPSGLRPDVLQSDVVCSKPTKNLLGWAPAQRLTIEQLRLLDSAAVGDGFAEEKLLTNTKITNLMNRIGAHFASIRQCHHVYLFRRLSSSNGSLVQGMSLEKRDKFYKFDRSTMYCEGIVSVCSPYRLNEKLTTGAIISGYRMAKELVGDRHSWCCYDFDEYKHVPESWVRSRNSIYTFGAVGRLNETMYTTASVSRRVIQNECILNTMIRSKEKWNVFQS